MCRGAYNSRLRSCVLFNQERTFSCKEWTIFTLWRANAVALTWNRQSILGKPGVINFIGVCLVLWCCRWLLRHLLWISSFGPVCFCRGGVLTPGVTHRLHEQLNVFSRALLLLLVTLSRCPSPRPVVRGMTPPPPETWFLGSSSNFKQLLFSEFIFSPKIFLLSCGWSKARYNATKHSSFVFFFFELLL